MKRIAVLCALCVASIAHADPKAWTAAKKIIPSNVFAVFSVDAGPIRASDLYTQLLPALIERDADVKGKFGEVKTTCGMDLPAVIDSMTVAVDDAGKGTIIIALKGLVQKDVEGCLGKLSKAHGESFTTDKVGDFTHYHMAAKDKDLYIRWLAKDVFAMATDPGDKDGSTAAMAGGLAKNKVLAGLLAGAKTSAAVWFAVLKQQDVEEFNAKVTGVYGNADLKSGNVAIEAHVVLDAEKGAADVAAKANNMVPMLISSGKVPPTMTALVKSLVIKSSGKEVIASAQATQKDILDTIRDVVLAH
jgi:hypothetical protein